VQGRGALGRARQLAEGYQPAFIKVVAYARGSPARRRPASMCGARRSRSKPTTARHTCPLSAPMRSRILTESDGFPVDSVEGEICIVLQDLRSGESRAPRYASVQGSESLSYKVEGIP